jgi:TolB-like protein/class 3 adenylate cyclase
MAEQRAQRRLAAILAADVVGYSRLMEIDEAGTLAVLKARRKDVLEPLVTEHQGRIVKLMGDGVFVEFASAVNAVTCAVALQKQMASANVGLPDDRHIVLRIGINLGDMMVEGTDLYGDGVNIATRLEGVAEPGGILISGTTYDHIKNKVQVGFDDRGTQTLKNIAEPVRVFSIAGTPRVSVPASKPAMDKPAIAVLPFANMSGDPAQQYFSDGITEDIITELSRFRELLVIASNSSFRYRDKAVDVTRVGRELGVTYVAEGSVRRSGQRVRITVQLLEATAGGHLWAEHYDREIEDIFVVQDEVVGTIAASLIGRIAAGSTTNAKRKPPQLRAAYDYFLHGRDLLRRYDWKGAEPLLRRAIDLDPNYAQAHALLSMTLMLRYSADMEESTPLGAERGGT